MRMSEALKAISNDREPTGTVPRLRDVSPEYDSLITTQNRLWERASSLREQRVAHSARVRGRRGSTSSESPDSPRALRIAAMIGDPAPEIVTTPDGDPDLRAIESEMEEIDDALKVIDARIRHEASRASIKVCELIAPAHAQLMQQLLKAMITLHRAHVDYSSFVEQIEAQKVRFSMLKPILPTFLGPPTGAGGPVAQFLCCAAELGWISVSELPPELRVRS